MSIWTQYKRLKAQVPGCLMLFRYGDFYELFDADAEVAAPILDIVLTSREMGQGARIKMAGIPHHALEGYLPKLLAAGHRVAVVEQVGQPARRGPSGPAYEEDPPPGERERAPALDGPGVMDREVVRVVSAGTVVEPGLLDERSNNYLAAVAAAGDRIGLAYADVTTGEFAACQLAGSGAALALQQELERLHPAEVLVPRPEGRGPSGELPPLPPEARATPQDAWRFELDRAREALLRHLGVASLDGFGCAGLPLVVQAAGALVQYLEDTQRSGSPRLTALRTYSVDGYVALDAATRRNLELTQTARGGAARGSLLWVLDQTRTAMGGRLLRRWLSQPLLQVAPLVARQDLVEELVGAPRLAALIGEQLARIGDLERLIHRVAQKLASPRDLVALRASLEAVAALRALGEGEVLNPTLTERERGARPGVVDLLAHLDACADIADLIGGALAPEPPAAPGEGVIAPGYSVELDELVSSSRGAREWIAGLEGQERGATGIKGLRVGYNKVFGYYLEVSHANRDLVPARYIRKQTLVGAERYITPELKEYEALVLGAQEQIAELEIALFRQLCAEVASRAGRVLATADAVARLDALASLAEVAVRQGYVRPALSDGPAIRIVEGRHPVVEVARKDVPFTPNDVCLSVEDAQIVVLTGPNMAGKSTYLRQVALIVLMAQIGSFVPAREAAIGLVDRIFTRIGAQDDLGAGQSTFLLEMLETANLLTQSTPRSLLILDEVGRGTSTYDGLAIAQAVVEHIHSHPRLRARTLFATHYLELTELEKFLPRVRNFRVDVAEEGDSVVFLHRVVPGAADRSYGIHVAQLAGVPRGVTRRAEEILRELEEGPRRRGRAGRQRDAEAPWQLSLCLEPDPIVEELRSLDVLSLTPIEALTRLFELQQRARGQTGR